MKKYVPLLFIILLSTWSCAQNNTSSEKKDNSNETTHQYQSAYFASGCFWCSESIFESVIGVTQVVSGYSGGNGENPTYQNYEKKGHAEAIKVIYDPQYISYEDLLTVYFSSQNPVQQNGQGPDLGSGYRSIIFYQNEEEKKLIQEKIKSVQKLYKDVIATEVMPFKKFWKAEEFHQNFERKNPNNPYIQNVSIPRLQNFQVQHPELLKKNN